MLRVCRMRCAGRVLLAIVEYNLLHIVNEPVCRAMIALGESLQGSAAHRLRIGDMQLLVQVLFWHVVDMRNKGERHPGTDSAHVPGERQVMILLETLKGLDGLDCAEDRNPQRYT